MCEDAHINYEEVLKVAKQACKCSTKLCPNITYFVLKVCEAARINYEEVLKVVKQACKCSTKLCPNWECTCEADSVTGELGEECTCLTCGWDDCSNCQVNNIY